MSQPAPGFTVVSKRRISVLDLAWTDRTYDAGDGERRPWLLGAPTPDHARLRQLLVSGCCAAQVMAR